MRALSLISVSLRSEGGSVSKLKIQIEKQALIYPLADFIFKMNLFSCCYTSFMCDVDWRAGGRVVSSSCNSIDCNGVVSTRIQIGDGCGGLSAGDRELFRRLAR